MLLLVVVLKKSGLLKNIWNECIYNTLLLIRFYKANIKLSFSSVILYPKVVKAPTYAEW